MTVRTEEPEDRGVDVDMRCAGVRYCPNALVMKLILACNVAIDFLLKDGGFYWNSSHVLDYVRQNELLNARSYGFFPLRVKTCVCLWCMKHAG